LDGVIRRIGHGNEGTSEPRRRRRAAERAGAAEREACRERAAADIDHAYGVVPPVAASDWAYATPTVAPGSPNLVVTKNTGFGFWAGTNCVKWIGARENRLGRHIALD